MGAGQIFGCLVCLIIVFAAIFFPVYYLSDEETQDNIKNVTGIDIPDLPPCLSDLPDSLRDSIPDVLDFHNEDPFQMTDPGDANRWDNDGSGLTLELVNALDSQWVPFFEVAVDEWENGSPDALTLSPITTNQPDPECTEITGLQKACNGDYGETDWKGINKVLIQGGFIVASMARMNDYFFRDGADEDKRHYTMCHELGHGFGLPHTDESFWNRDLGNCLDYTNNYSGNKSPDQGNYEYLTALYGSVDGSIPAGDPSATEYAQDDDTTAEQRAKAGNRRNLRSGKKHHRALFHAVEDKSQRRELQAKWKEIDDIVNDTSGALRRRLEVLEGWRLLHRTEYGEAHEIDLGYDYRAQIHMLRA